MGEIFTVADLPGYSGWRETEEEKQAYEQRRREIEEERERKRKAVATEKQKREVANKSDAWYDAVDTRIRTHFKDWAWAAIDERIDKLTQEWWKHEYKDLMSVLIEVVETIRKRVHDRFTSIEERQRSFETKLAEPKERLLALNNSVDEAQGRLREEVRQAIKEISDAFGAEIRALEARLRAVPGTLPAVKTYRPDTVHYAGHMVVHQGATYQALRDTARAPPHVDDWVCVASAGCDGQSVRVRGAFAVHKKYTRFDVVEYEGSSFVALHDDPGNPWDGGWQLVSRSGSRGPAGERGARGGKGERGARGEDGREIVSWYLEPGTYRAFPTYADGKLGPELNLRPLFEQFNNEAVGPAVDAAVTAAR